MKKKSEVPIKKKRVSVARKYEKAINSVLKSDVFADYSASKRKTLKGLHTGSYCLNDALSGISDLGFVWGRIVEIYGPEQSGKTTVALHCIRECQKEGNTALFVDAEHALDLDYASNIGVNVEDLSVCQPDYGEQALSVVEQGLLTGYRLIVIDSVPALTPRAELEGDMGDAHMGLQARMMGQGLRKLTGLVSKKQAIIIFLNQIRMKLGVFFGNPETTPGGKALKYFSSYRLEIRSPRGGAVKEKDIDDDKPVETGILANIKIVKNKLYPPYRKTVVPIRYGVGIDRYVDVANFLKLKGVFSESRLKLLGKSYTHKTLSRDMRTDNKLEMEVLKYIKGMV